MIIDIGSGSVGVALVISNANQSKPQIVWTKREFVIIKDMPNTEVPLKEITTSLINIFLQIGSEGLKKLHDVDRSLKITDIQVHISAPWTYTVTKTVNFTDEHSFFVTKDFINELSATAEKQAFDTVLENKKINENNLEIIDNKTITIRVNGYVVDEPKNVQTREITVSHLTAITQKQITDVLTDSKNKVLPAANLITHSFMYIYYNTLRKLRPDIKEVCLVAITSEATEIGIVREGVLTFVTHAHFGTFSIAREIALLCKIPKEEAYLFMKGGKSFLESKLTAGKKKKLEVILDSYEERIADLFKKTGDQLSVPKTVFLHGETETETENFFVEHITNAAKIATTVRHNVHPITKILFDSSIKHDTALLLSACNYHQTHLVEINE